VCCGQEVNVLLQGTEEEGLDLVEHLGCVLEVTGPKSPLHDDLDTRLSSAGVHLDGGPPAVQVLAEYSRLRSQTLEVESQALYGSLLPRMVRQLLEISTQPATSLFMINEQYIVKPPGAGAASAFRWHTVRFSF